jgi:hypothetical protein
MFHCADDLQCARFDRASDVMPRFGPTFPAFDVWQKMSESEQDALLGSMERSRRRNGLVGILIAVLLMAATGGALYLASLVRP